MKNLSAFNSKYLLGSLISIFFLTGCATVFEGTSQPISVTLTPESTICRVYRENRELGALTNNNPVLYTQRSPKELVLVCHAQGFQPRMLRLVSSPSGLGAIGVAGGGVGVVNTISNEFGWDNIVANSKSTTSTYLGLIPGVVDMITGAYWRYDNQINIVLEPTEF